jgi:hypothetical protein
MNWKDWTNAVDNPKLNVGTQVRIIVPSPTGTIIEMKNDLEYHEIRYKVEYVDEQGSCVWDWFSAYELEIE